MPENTSNTSTKDTMSPPPLPPSPTAFELEKLKAEKTKNNIEQMKIIGDHYRMDIKQVWERSRFFITINFALLVFIHSDKFNADSGRLIYYVGLAASIIWLFAMYITKRWIDEWKDQLVSSEKKSGVDNTYFHIENRCKEDGIAIHKRCRPQMLSIFMASLFCLAWVYAYCKPPKKMSQHECQCSISIPTQYVQP